MKQKIAILSAFCLILPSAYAFGNFLGLFKKNEPKKPVAEIVQEVAPMVLPKTVAASPVMDMLKPPADRQWFSHAQRFPFEFQKREYTEINSWWLAEASVLSYAGIDVIQNAMNALGYPGFRAFSGPKFDGQAFVAWQSTHAILIFRGTEPTSYQDLLTDSRFKLVNWNGVGRVHLGFRDAFEELHSDQGLAAFLASLGDIPVFIAGHSMGGALATLAASRYPSSRAIYSFGAPRAGDRSFVQSVRIPSFRVVNRTDLVVDVPPYIRGVTSFDHSGELVQINSDSSVQSSRNGHLGSNLKALALGGLFGNSGSAKPKIDVTQSIYDHMPLAYADSLGTMLQK